MTSHHPIRRYVDALALHLRKLDKADAAEVIQEIESHIHEVIEQTEARGEVPDVDALLQGFGPPEVLAAQYVAHIRTGAPPPAGFRVIQRVKQTVTRGLYYSMGAFGYSVAIALLLLAVAKLWQPSLVGAWSINGGHSVAIAWSGPPYQDAKEILGYWLVPIALLASTWCAVLTHRVMRILQVLRRGLP